MEEHRRRQSAQGMLRPHSRPSTLRPTINIPDFGHLRVYVSNPDAHQTGRQIINAFRSMGASVAYTSGDDKTGLAQARECGARYIPSNIKQPLEYFKDTDLIIRLHTDACETHEDIETWTIGSEGLNDPTLANYLLLKAASHPLLNPVAYRVVSKS